MHGIPVYGGSLIDVTDLVKDAVASHNNGRGSRDEEGIIPCSTRKIKIHLRDHHTEQPIDDDAGNMVYAYLEQHMERYMLLFYSRIQGVETAYAFTRKTYIDVSRIPMSVDYANLPWDIFADTNFMPVPSPRTPDEEPLQGESFDRVIFDDADHEEEEKLRKKPKRRIVKI